MKSFEFVYDLSEKKSPGSTAFVNKVFKDIFKDIPVTFTQRENAPYVFGANLPKLSEIVSNVDKRLAFVRAVKRMRNDYFIPTPWGDDDTKVLFLDIETHNAEMRWDMPLDDFFRLGQYGWGYDGEIVLTTDIDEVLYAIDEAVGVVAHNGHTFDFSVLLGDKALGMSRKRKLFDTMIFANQVMPPPFFFETRSGRRASTIGKPEIIGTFLSLDHLAFELGVDGKAESLRELAKEFNPPGTKQADIDFGLIPINDKRFREYARQDIVVLRGVLKELLRIQSVTDVEWREQMTVAIDAQMMRNGFNVDVPLVTKRHEEQMSLKHTLLSELQEKYNFPQEGKKPWSTKVGKQAILDLMADNNITPENTEWERTKSGALSFSKDVILDITKGTPAEELGMQLAQLSGMRTLPEQVLDNIHTDNRLHPDISCWQRSRRRSVTKPGLTTWGERSGKENKEYLIASPGHKLIEFDLSNADQRIVVLESGDLEYAKNFVDGADPYEIPAILMFGEDEYLSKHLPGWETSAAIRKKNPLRNIAKGLSHAYAYGASAHTLSLTAGQPLELAKLFVQAMQRGYPGVIAWQNRVREEATRQNGFMVSRWGTRMRCQPDKIYTQAPAFHGQSGTTNILYDGLLRLPDEILMWLVCPIHDAVLFDIPEDKLEWAIPIIREKLTVDYGIVKFTVSEGTPSDTWYGASH